VLVDGKPHFFFNPKRNGLSGGAYGNSITYVLSEGKEYFDIPVGSLTDRRPSEVHRVHATDGIAPETHKVGDSTGVFYTLGAGAGSPVYATGIAAWQDSCGAGQTSEILLDLDTIGGQAADPPSGGRQPHGGERRRFRLRAGRRAASAAHLEEDPALHDAQDHP
jgi:hypothetical protein